MTTGSWRVLCAGAVLLCLTRVASASVHFRFTGDEQSIENVPIAPVSGSGLTVVTTGHLSNPAADADGAALSYQTPLGLGVNNTNIQPADRDPVILSIFQTINTFVVEGDGAGEFIRLQFSEPVQLDLVYFTDAGPGERFSLLADGRPIDIPSIFGTDVISQIHPAGMVQFPAGMPFATTYDFYAHSSWTLHNVHVNGGVIPEPTTGMIWCGLALPLLGWRSRRRLAARR